MPLTSDLAGAIEPWFDDVDTARFLGDRGWPHEALRLVELMSSGAWPEPDVVERHSWVAFDDNEPVGMLGVESYVNGTASMSIVVCPEKRRRSYGAALVDKAHQWATANGVSRLVVGAEPANSASLALLGRTGFRRQAMAPDEEGFLNYALELGP